MSPSSQPEDNTGLNRRNASTDVTHKLTNQSPITRRTDHQSRITNCAKIVAFTKGNFESAAFLRFKHCVVLSG